MEIYLHKQYLIQIFSVGSYDFFGLNFYTAEVVEPYEFSISEVSYYADMDVKREQPNEWLPWVCEPNKQYR